MAFKLVNMAINKQWHEKNKPPKNLIIEQNGKAIKRGWFYF